MIELTLRQMFQISHAFGVDMYKSIMSHNLKDKILPTEFYRNRFQAQHDDVFEQLVLNGYAIKTQWQELPFYYVNEIGEKQFRKQFYKLCVYKPRKLRDLEYLKNRINIYCAYYNYRFCDDNSEHVIDYYVNYYINKFYVSHTTSNCINTFKKELKSYYKKGLLTKYKKQAI